jgi:Short C-terminal domain
MGLIAERGAARMQARQNYSTMARMQRRRSFIQDKLGAKEDFSSRQQQLAQTAAPAPPAAPEPEYVRELERLAQLRQQGILSDEEFEAKKKQILGI